MVQDSTRQSGRSLDNEGFHCHPASNLVSASTRKYNEKRAEQPATA
jgi:hypothetical protein